MNGTLDVGVNDLRMTLLPLYTRVGKGRGDEGKGQRKEEIRKETGKGRLGRKEIGNGRNLGKIGKKLIEKGRDKCASECMV